MEALFRTVWGLAAKLKNKHFRTEFMNKIKKAAQKNERKARESEQRKNDLVVNLAHDIQTPPSSVIGYLSLLHEASNMPTELRAKYTDITLEKAYRLEQLIYEFFEIPPA